MVAALELLRQENKFETSPGYIATTTKISFAVENPET